jgi:hypothetical protein
VQTSLVDDPTGTLRGTGLLEPPLVGDGAPRDRSRARASSGGATLEEIGVVLHVTRERIRQIEAKALRKLRAGLATVGIEDAAGFAHGLGLAEELALAGGADPGRSGFRSSEVNARAQIEREADAWALSVFELRVLGVPMRVAWSLANGAKPPGDEVTAMARASTTNGAAKMILTSAAPDEKEETKVTPVEAPAAVPSSAASTAALVQAVEQAKAALRARRDALRAELELAQRALAGEPELEASGSRRGRVLAFLEEHPRSRAPEIAAAIEDDAGAVSGALCALRKGGRATSTGSNGSLRWSLA